MREVWRTWRFRVSLLAGSLCLLATLFVGTILTWILLLVAFGLLLDGITGMWERAGGVGNLTTHRQ
jgi:hypothetical protein